MASYLQCYNESLLFCASCPLTNKCDQCIEPLKLKAGSSLCMCPNAGMYPKATSYGAECLRCDHECSTCYYNSSYCLSCWRRGDLLIGHRCICPSGTYRNQLWECVSLGTNVLAITISLDDYPLCSNESLGFCAFCPF